MNTNFDNFYQFFTPFFKKFCPFFVKFLTHFWFNFWSILDQFLTPFWPPNPQKFCKFFFDLPKNTSKKNDLKFFPEILRFFWRIVRIKASKKNFWVFWAFFLKNSPNKGSKVDVAACIFFRVKNSLNKIKKGSLFATCGNSAHAFFSTFSAWKQKKSPPH